MADTDVRATDRNICYARPILGTVDALGYLEVAGPIPAEEMGLRSGRRVRLVGTLYDPETVGEAYVEHDATPRPLRRPVARRAGRAAGRPTRHTAYQDRTTVRVAKRGETTRARYAFHEPDLAGMPVAVVTGRARRGAPLWAAALALLLATTVAAGVLDPWRDPRARRGHYEDGTPEEVRAGLDAEVDWWSMEISVASHMEIREGETALEARIENSDANHCDQRVRIYPTSDPSDTLFESGAIAPGEWLRTVELAHPLPVGSNELTVEFQGYEQGVSLVSDEGVLLGHDTFGTSCAAEVTVWCRPAGVAA